MGLQIIRQAPIGHAFRTFVTKEPLIPPIKVVPKTSTCPMAKDRLPKLTRRYDVSEV